jgi:outer membrane protein OmpA-like peptidoglycan-associated protein
MRGDWPRAILVASLAAACAGACKSTPVVEPSVPASDLVVLLVDADTGAVGRVRVSNAEGAIDLVSARAATRIVANQPPSPIDTLTDAQVVQAFGDALSALPPPPLSFTLHFRFESDELTDEALALVPRILQSVKDRFVPDVLVVGHTDTAGSTAANLTLGLRRAGVVRDLLVTAGLDPTAVEVISNGERNLLVPTDDETPEARNRRVEISVR